VGNKNFIEINGKKYDALTGRMIANSTNNSSISQSIAVVAPKMNTGVVDGFVRKST
jgi:hypothetical protein